jgi:transposase-like protein
MSRGYRKFSPEFREEITKLAIDSPKTIAEIAREYHMHETTLGNWVRAYKEKHGEAEEPLTLTERARLRELERKNRELEMKCAFLSKAAAYFAAEHR